MPNALLGLIFIWASIAGACGLLADAAVRSWRSPERLDSRWYQRAVPCRDAAPYGPLLPPKPPARTDEGATADWSPTAELMLIERTPRELSLEEYLAELDATFTRRMREIEAECAVGSALEEFVQDSMHLRAYRALRLERTGEFSRAELAEALTGAR